MSNSSIITINPATEEVCGKYPLMNQEDVESIILNMHIVQKVWARSEVTLRQQFLLNLTDILRKNRVKVATLITQEMGKPITQALAEVEKCEVLCEYYAKEGEGFLKPHYVQTEYYKSYRSYEPLGTVFSIMPWNFPLWQALRSIVPNLMAGNACLLKHAPNSTGLALLLEKFIVEAGFPEDLFRVLVIDVALSPFIIHHQHVMGVTLTGSNKAGKSVAREAGAALKKVVLELGGSDPYIILEDADLNNAAEQCVKSRLNNAGQVCIAAKRIIVVEKIKKEFERLVIEKAKKYIMGDPLSPDTLLGPMARSDLRDTLHDQVKRAILAGATCVTGAEIPSGKGFYYPVTILTEVSINSPAFTEELFGPVICIIPAHDERHAISLANSTPFGLAGAIFTKDLEKGEEIARNEIFAGTCAVNVLVSSDPRLPFGGIKQSGFGRELSVEGMREFVNIKTVIVSREFNIE